MSTTQVSPNDIDLGETPYQVLPELAAEEYRALKQDIEQNGIIVPITVDDDGNVIDGHHRLRAARELGIDEPPMQVRDDLDDEAKRSLAYRLNMQRRQVDQQTKKSLIKQRLNELIDAGVDKTDEEVADELGASQSFVARVRKTVVNDKISDGGKKSTSGNFTTVTDYATTEQKDKLVKELLVENPTKPDRAIAEQIGISHPTVSSKRDELAELHRPELIRTDVQALLPQIPTDTFDLIATDPPYGVEFDGNRYDTAEHDALEGDEDTDLVTGIASELSRVLKADRHCYVFCRWDVLPDVLPAYEAAFDSVDTVIVWDKDDGGHGMGDLEDFAPRHELIIKCSNGKRPVQTDTRPPNVIRQQDARFTDGDKSHPTEKPRPLLEQLIEASTESGEIVFDPFGGVHTTAAAALVTGRRAVSVEVDTDHHAAGRDRIDGLLERERDDRTLVYDVEVVANGRK